MRALEPWIEVESRNVHVQKISILLPQKGLEYPGGVGGSVRPKNLKKCVKLYWNFKKGGEVWYGYFLELHNAKTILRPSQ